MGESAANDSRLNTNDAAPSEKRGLSAKALKWIAMITMAIDHTAIAVIIPASKFHYFTGFPLEELYYVCRMIGRLAFPLFIYLIVDSFFYTRNRKRFVIGLLVFALISEVPFDITVALPVGGHFDTIWDWIYYQNVYFTLLVGVLCMLFSEYVLHGSAAVISDRAVREQQQQGPEDTSGEHSPAFRVLMVALITVLGCLLASFLRCDYGLYGVLAIVFAYLIRRTGHKKLEIFGIVLPLAVNSFVEIIALVDWFLIFASNGKRGNIRHKWLYYIFYPAHLAILAGIKLYIVNLMGML